MKKHLNRVVVTGMGALTPLSEDIEIYWSNLLKGISGIGPMELADSTEYPCKISGEVSGFDPRNYMDLKDSRRMARFSQLAVASAGLAIKDARLDFSTINPDKIGVLLGNGNGGFPTTEENAKILFSRGGMKVSPFFIPMVLPNMAAANVSRIFSIKGYTSTIITACAAGTQAIGEATEVIRRGTADIIITGGCEAGISQLGLGGFNVIKALTRNNGNPVKASRPFDANRDGFVPAEGSATLILESLQHAIKREANILAEVIGYGVSSDAYHLVQPDEDASGPARAIQWALDNAGITTNQVDYINAHGTSTPKNDLVETKAIKKVFKEKAYDIPISSTKSMTGHALGGAGALEAVVCIKTILSNTIHPTINYETPDKDCDLDYVPNKSRINNVDIALSNRFGFGGQNACLLFSKYYN